jgi:hypothetical protein
MLLHGGGFGRVQGRPLAAWTAALEGLGLDVQSCPMNGRPPFANRLLVGRLPALEGRRGREPRRFLGSEPVTDLPANRRRGSE